MDGTPFDMGATSSPLGIAGHRLEGSQFALARSSRWSGSHPVPVSVEPNGGESISDQVTS